MEEKSESKNNPPRILSINLHQRSQEYKMQKGSLFNEWCWENWATACERIKRNHYLTGKVAQHHLTYFGD